MHFISWVGAGGGNFFFLVDFLIPKWGRSAIVGPILMNIFCPNWGCGLVCFFVDFLNDFSWGVVGFTWIEVLCDFLGDGLSSSWQSFLLGVLIFGTFLCGVNLGVAGSSVPPANRGEVTIKYLEVGFRFLGSNVRGWQFWGPNVISEGSL